MEDKTHLLENIGQIQRYINEVGEATEALLPLMNHLLTMINHVKSFNAYSVAHGGPRTDPKIVEDAERALVYARVKLEEWYE